MNNVVNLKHLVIQIEQLLENEFYIPALYLALIIPDICSKIDYPEEKKQMNRYTKWVYEHLDKYDLPKDPYDSGFEHLNAKRIYSLRNNLFHESTAEFEHDIENLEFKLLEGKDRISCYQISKNENNIKSFKMYVSIEDLCRRLCAHTKKYIDRNEEGNQNYENQ